MNKNDWVLTWQAVVVIYRVFEPLIIGLLVLNFLLDLAREHFDGA